MSMYGNLKSKSQEYQARYYVEHLDERRAYQRQYYLRHLDKKRAYARVQYRIEKLRALHQATSP